MSSVSELLIVFLSLWCYFVPARTCGDDVPRLPRAGSAMFLVAATLGYDQDHDPNSPTRWL